MRPTLGLNAYEIIFDTITPIMQARLAADVSRQAQEQVPRAQVQAVDVYEVKQQDGTSVIYTDVVYTVAGQQISQQIPLTTGNG